jgi:uncharacterized OB-fold protein
MAARTRAITAPPLTPEAQPFWEAAERGELLIKGCQQCGQVHFYPRAICPFCMSDKTEWKPASGRGTIYSYSTLKRAEPPYTIAYVTLEEGPTMMTNIVDCDPDTIRIGQKVAVAFKPTDGGPPVPMFSPTK